MFDVKKLTAIQIGLASPEAIRSWSRGEVLKPETINYRSTKPEMDGLYCEKIFGPSKDYECHCGKYKKIRFQGIKCEKCGVEVTTKDVRRERMGHIELHSPCTHIWYLKGSPSRIATLLSVSPKDLEEVVYYAGHFVLNPGKSERLYKGQFINEKKGPEVFGPVLNEIKDNALEFGLIEGTDEYYRLLDYIEKLGKEKEVFDYTNIARFITKHTGAIFSEGASAVKQLLEELDLDEEARKISAKLKDSSKKDSSNTVEKLTKRLELIHSFKNSGNKPEWMVLDVIPVIPPDLRPMLALDGGRYATSDLNDLYRRVISRNNRLKKMIDMNAPQAVLMNEKRMLQEAVDALIDNGRRNKPVQGTSNRPLKSLSSALKGKQGRFRQNLLGKRVDYSGRSVIAVGPTLRMYECGLPREMAVQLLRPFIACELLKRNFVSAHKQADKIIDRYDPIVLDIVEEIIGKHPVLLNRAPTLHRLGIQAFRPVLVDGRAIRLHPLVCTGFNADFDGDQMAVHVPLSKAAQEEALHLMLASGNILGPKDGKPIVTPSQDLVLGNYYLTLEKTKEDFLAKAEVLKEQGDFEEAERYELYAASEGKAFASIDDILLAYQTKQVHLHNRIAVLGKALKKTTFTEEMNNSYLLTTVGKIIFNLIFPSDFPYINILESNKVINLDHDLEESFAPRGTNLKERIASTPLNSPFKKKQLGQIINKIFQNYDRNGNPKTSAVLDKIKDQGFRFSTVAGFTVSIDDIEITEGKESIIKDGDTKVERITKMYREGLLTDEERHSHVVNVWTEALKQVKKNVSAKIEKESHSNPIFMMSDSGARGNLSNITQLLGMRGLMGNTSGGTIELPVKSCFREGLTVSEFFIATHGARKGGADTAIKTADSGYLTRKLVDVSQDVIVREEDCGTDHGFIVEELRDASRENALIVSLENRLVGRYTLEEVVNPTTGEIIIGENELIDEVTARTIVAAGIKQVKIRSIFGCETKDGVCVHCYGRNLATGRVVSIGEAVGIMAAQSIGEPGTQLTMRTFHTGGVAGSDITQGLPRVKELFDAQTPKGEALIANFAGKVTNIEEKNGAYLVTVVNEEVIAEDGNPETEVYETNYGARLRVKVGDHVTNGGKITEGTISPKKLLRVSDVTEVEKYILKEVHKVYASQDIGISDKHIEVIIRQMLRRVFVIDAGDTNLLAGTRVSLNVLTEANDKALREGKRPAFFTPLVLGITKAALETDSFLSAASFQETTRILTDAAIRGKRDSLHGLKENVITGHLIPAGRGLMSQEDQDKALEGFTVESTMKEIEDRYVEIHDKALQAVYDKIEELNENN